MYLLKKIAVRLECVVLNRGKRMIILLIIWLAVSILCGIVYWMMVNFDGKANFTDFVKVVGVSLLWPIILPIIWFGKK